MRDFARSRARSLWIDGAYDVVKEETGVFVGLLTRTMGAEIAGMARDTTFEGEYRCIHGTQES